LAVCTPQWTSACSIFDRYTLVQLFSRYGKITKLDYLFHKTGPMKGKPRGYAFIQYASHDSAEKAITACDGKLIRGRKITVSYASEAPQMEGRSSRMHEIDRSKVTTLSLLKSRRGPAGTGDKIAALEAKLKEIERSKDSVSTPTLSKTGLGSLPPRPLDLPPNPTS